MQKSAPLVIFDLDGTLVDSARDFIPALNKTVAPLNIPEIAFEDVGHVVGQGALRMIERVYEFHDIPLETGGDLHHRLLGQFLEIYERDISVNTVFYPGALNALTALDKQGWKLAICTNKYERLARKLLDELQETSRFYCITGGDTFSHKKPDPRHLISTCQLADALPSRSIMVGDSINDIEAAQRADIPVIAVDFGYTDVPVNELNPDKIISHFDELVEAVGDCAKNFK